MLGGDSKVVFKAYGVEIHLYSVKTFKFIYYYHRTI